MPHQIMPLSNEMIQDVLTVSLINQKYFLMSIEDAKKSKAPQPLVDFIVQVNNMADGEFLQSKPNEESLTRFLHKKVVNGIHIVTLGTHFGTDKALEDNDLISEGDAEEEGSLYHPECQCQSFLLHSDAGVNAVAEAAGTFVEGLSREALLKQMLEESLNK